MKLFKNKYRVKGTFNKNMDKRWVLQYSLSPFYWTWENLMIYEQGWIALKFKTYDEAREALDHYLTTSADRYAD